MSSSSHDVASGPPSEGHRGGVVRLVLTQAEFATYERELRDLRRVRGEELPRRLRDARSYVGADASEDIGKIQEEQTIVDARIARLEDLLGDATIVDGADADDVVTVGSTVEVLYQRTGRQAAYRVTGAAQAVAGGCVSSRSPVGSRLLGRRAGDVVSVDLPNGSTERLTVVRVAPAYPRVA